MYLKSIEVQGFKSFANKIHFQFHNGITCIVGPNGSGKSNVADAVRWVLGEQRIKQLRGASMQDVIFSGTELRKPLGYAYVAITLDNADHHLSIDYEEVTVARRIYRSGESEYLINGTPCRLKDVNELFYDTGIGKEGYSIIGQGQIDKILSGKPEERRELFDEAAGIVKFKRRKNTAQKKLEEEKQNLLRVSDILAELEKQTGPLEKQSEKAKIYLKKKEELKTLDVNLFLLENKRLKEQMEEIIQKQRIADTDLEETSQKYEQIKVSYEQLQEELEQLEQRIETARTQMTDSGLLKGRLEGEINVLKEQINSARGRESHFTSRKDALQKEMEDRQREQESILSDKKRMDEQLSNVQKQREEARERLQQLQDSMEELSRRIEAGKNAIIEALNHRAGIKSQMGSLDTMLEQIRIRKAELTSRLLRAKSDEVKQEETMQQLQEQFESINEEIGRLKEVQASQEEKLELLQKEISQKDTHFRDAQVNYHQEKSRLDALSNLTERYEGYGGSVKRVMECREQETGIIGVVADIIQVEKQYETAIETALGGSIQNIVTEDEETAKRMIAFLKKHKAGRATFLPLTSISRPQEFRQTSALKEEGVVGTADSLVQVEDRYRNVAKSMLGRVLVVDHVDHALKLARKYSYSLRIVTLEGEQLVPGGAISGGAFKNSSNLLGRRREIDELKEKVHLCLKQVDDLLQQIETVKKERTIVRRQLEETKARLQEKFIQQNTARLNVIQARERKQEAENGFDQLKKEELEMEKSIREMTDKKAAIQRELEESLLLETEKEEENERFRQKLEAIRSQEGLQSQKVASHELEAERMQQQQAFHRQNAERIQGELERFYVEQEAIQQGLVENKAEIQQKLEKIAQLEQTILASHTSQTDAEVRMKADIETKEALAARQKQFFVEREELAEQMGDLDKEVYRLKVQGEKLEEAMETQINYMWDEYEITLSVAAGLRDEKLQDLVAIKRASVEVKEQIKKLGDVNVNAIEDYKNLMERYTFLKGQHEDLVEAEKTLLHLIEELDEAMRKQFQEKFGEIAREFDKVFKELFGGGKGTLELMEEEDLLEAGVRIIAQPPGKKLQNMMQLSGGEKALTAIALLFAIQNLKPSPFCLLDEIEAALDESNVGRFAKYLHKLTKDTQFIVITHRRGTMERADRLYGITMQEKGISTLVSVNLTEASKSPISSMPSPN
ncbi:MAG: chromosome segregation protein SMC [Lachnospiraceae bacterium]|nr:chromosome segregation protein SMC [Lachnospiraceae bacterium]